MALTNKSNNKNLLIEVVDGEIRAAKRVYYRRPQDVVIKHYTIDGNTECKPGDGNKTTCYMWECISPGIDPSSVVSVRYPELNYGNSDTNPYTVEITVYLYDENNENEKITNEFNHS